MSETLKIAETLEKLVEKSIVDFQHDLDVLRVPASFRVPMWHAIARRAMAKAVECERIGWIAAVERAEAP